jgi:hypothetical protein
MPLKDEQGQLIASVEFGQFAGIEDHEMESEMKVAVNKPLTGLASANSQRVFGERIEVYKKKLGAHVNPQGEMVAFNKKWKAFQKPLGAPKGELSSPTSRYKEQTPMGYPSEAPAPSRYGNDPSPIAIMKNVYDELRKDVRNMGNWVKVGLILGALGTVGLIVSLALALK